MTPVEELRAAAQKVREARSAVKAVEPLVPGEIDDWTKYYGQETSHGLPSGDAPWIATMHPGLAEPIAAWLDGCADEVASTRHTLDQVGRRSGYSDLEEVREPDSVRRALTLARAILQTPKET